MAIHMHLTVDMCLITGVYGMYTASLTACARTSGEYQYTIVLIIIL